MWESGLYWGAMAMVVYGALHALAELVLLVGSLRRPHRVLAYLVLVRDQADRVEGVVRALAQLPSSDLLLVDLGSADESPAILERLTRHYEHARLFRFGRTERSQAIAAALRATQAPCVVLVDLDEWVGNKGKI